MYYLLFLPALIFFIVYKYLPMVGTVIAFKQVAPFDGINAMLHAPWVGLKYFKKFFGSAYFWNIIGNTLHLSLANLLLGMPAPIIFALLLNEVRGKKFKRTVQTISYLPHFISVVVVSGIVLNIFSPETGLVSAVVKALGGTPEYYLGSNKYIRSIIVGSTIWQEMGWNSIIYLAAITCVPVDLYEVAKIDGANRFQRIWYITIPSIMFTVTIMFIMQVGKILNFGFERVLLLYTPVTYETADIIDTYVYRVGLMDANYSFSTAVGLFKSVFGLIMVVGTNYITKRLGQEGIW